MVGPEHDKSRAVSTAESLITSTAPSLEQETIGVPASLDELRHSYTVASDIPPLEPLFDVYRYPDGEGPQLIDGQIVFPAGDPEPLNLSPAQFTAPIDRLGLDLDALADRLNPEELGPPVASFLSTLVPEGERSGRPFAIPAPPEVQQNLGFDELEVQVSRIPHRNGTDFFYSVSVYGQREFEPGSNPLERRELVGTFYLTHEGLQPTAQFSLPTPDQAWYPFNTLTNDAQIAYFLPLLRGDPPR